MTKEIPPLERRKFGRKESSVAAQAIIPGRAGVRCMIRNVSVAGALVEFDSRFSARGAFRLYADGGALDAQCVIRREEGNELGVEFISVAVNKLAEAPAQPTAAVLPPDHGHRRELMPSRGSDLRARLFGTNPVPEATPAITTVPAARPDLPDVRIAPAAEKSLAPTAEREHYTSRRRPHLTHA